MEGPLTSLGFGFRGGGAGVAAIGRDVVSGSAAREQQHSPLRALRSPTLHGMRTRILAAAVTAVLVLPAVALAAAALPPGFVPYRSVSRVALGMFERTVRARLGPPSLINAGNLHGVVSQLVYSRRHPGQSLLITFDPHRRGDPVVRIQASGASFHNARGVGIGSTRSAIRRVLPHLKCQGFACSGSRGHTLLTLDFDHGRVSLINLIDTRFRFV